TFRYLGTVTASESGHGFTWPIPNSLRDGQAHNIQVYLSGQSDGKNYCAGIANTGQMPAITCAPMPDCRQPQTTPAGWTVGLTPGQTDARRCEVGITGWALGQDELPLAVWNSDTNQYLGTVIASDQSDPDQIDAVPTHRNHAFVWPIPNA